LLEGSIMLVGALVPFHDTGGDPDTVREYAQALEAAGYNFLAGPSVSTIAGLMGSPADHGELLSWLFYVGTGLGPLYLASCAFPASGTREITLCHQPIPA
jgi:hypothetical protein